MEDIFNYGWFIALRTLIFMARSLFRDIGAKSLLAAYWQYFSVIWQLEVIVDYCDYIVTTCNALYNPDTSRTLPSPTHTDGLLAMM